MKTRSAIALGMGLLVLSAAGASAQTLVNARVLSATPIYESVPVTRCTPTYGNAPSGAGAAVGALMGGLVGSQIGSGSGAIAGTILGTVGGAFLGNAAEAQQRAYDGCGTAYEQRLSGYDVTYELAGQTYRTRTAQEPGAWLQVPVAGNGYAQPYAGNDGYAYGQGVPVQTYPVAPAPAAGYPLPAYPASGQAVVTAPPGALPGSAYGYPAPPAYTTPVGPPPIAVSPAPVVVRPAPAYVAPVGVSLSVGGGFGRHSRGGWGVTMGPSWGW